MLSTIRIQHVAGYARCLDQYDAPHLEVSLSNRVDGKTGKRQGSGAGWLWHSACAWLLCTLATCCSKTHGVCGAVCAASRAHASRGTTGFDVGVPVLTCCRGLLSCCCLCRTWQHRLRCLVNGHRDACCMPTCVSQPAVLARSVTSWLEKKCLQWLGLCLGLLPSTRANTNSPHPSWPSGRYYPTHLSSRVFAGAVLVVCVTVDGVT